MIETNIKIEIAKEVLIKSGFVNDKKVVDSIGEAVRDNRFIFELDSNKVVMFVSWLKPQIIENKNTLFVNNLWIDSEYRNREYVIRIRTILRKKFPNTKAIWFNRKKQKLVERI